MTIEIQYKIQNVRQQQNSFNLRFL